MTEQTDPPLWALDMAAKAAEWSSWEGAQTSFDTTKRAIRAHARTLAKYEKPVDPDLQLAREAVAKRYEGSRGAFLIPRILAGEYTPGSLMEDRVQVALAKLLMEKEQGK